MIRTLCRGTALYDDRRRTNLHHVGDSSKIQNELGETVNQWLYFLLLANHALMTYTQPRPGGGACVVVAGKKK